MKPCNKFESCPICTKTEGLGDPRIGCKWFEKANHISTCCLVSSDVLHEKSGSNTI